MSQIHSVPPARPVAAPAGDETTVDSAAPAGSARRREAPRHPALPGARAEVRPWGGGAGPNVALELLDVSELGVRVRLRLPVRVSDRFEVTLWDADGIRLAQTMAVIRWSTCSLDGTVVAGLELSRPLMPDLVRRLAGPPIIPTRAAPPPAGAPRRG